MSSPREELGHIYIASNPAMPGYVKIGYTALKLDARISQLSQSTSVPLPFVLEESMLVEYPAKIEALLHSKLRNYRPNPKREFFNVSVDHAYDELRMILWGTTDMNVEDDIKLLVHLYEKYKHRFNPIDKAGMTNAVIELLDLVDVIGWTADKKQSVIDHLKSNIQ